MDNNEINVTIHESCYVSDEAKIGNGSIIWHYSQIMEHAIIGEKCIIGQNAFVASGVKIGHRVKMQNNISVYNGVEIEDDVFIGPSAVLNPRAHVERKSEFRSTLIKKGSSIGANATILCGVTIGDYAMVGAGSVVTKSVKNYELVVGNPAKHIGWRSKNGFPLTFVDSDECYCKEEALTYAIKNDLVFIKNDVEVV